MQEKTLNSESILSTALGVFSDINTRIHSLIDCSARDFDILNQSFKEYFSRIQLSTEDTKSRMETILEIPESALEEIRTYLQQITMQSDSRSGILQEIVIKLKAAAKNISYAYLNLNNVKQNIGTLKLLATNIQFDPEKNIHYASLIKKLLDLAQHFSDFEGEINTFEKRVQACAEVTQQIIKKQLPICIREVKHMYDLIDSIDQKKSECAEYTDILEKLLNEKSGSSSEIITNLQFQDIIRQKIEHVQQAHEILQQNLKQAITKESKSSKTGGNELLNIEVLFQIRDIGSLQAAQLVHANNEYQNAVENITNKFSTLDEILSETGKLQSKLMPDTTVKNNSLKQFTKNTSLLEIECDNLGEINAILKHSFEGLLSNSGKLDAFPGIIEKSIDEIRATINSIKQTVKTEGIEHIDPLDQLSDNLASFQLKLKKLFDIVFKEDCIVGSLKVDDIERYLKEHENTEKVFITMLNTCKEIENKVNKGNNAKINTETEQVSSNELNIEKVEYYKVFDREVEEIIKLLNSLINKIDFEKLDQQYDRKELEVIRNNYTMESERLIHDKQAGIEHSKDDEDDIELFT